MKKSGQLRKNGGIADDDLTAMLSKKEKTKSWQKWLLAVAAVCIGLTVIWKSGPEEERHVLAKAEYPEKVKFPDSRDYYDEKENFFDEAGYEQAYQSWMDAQATLEEGKQKNIQNFFENTFSLLLSKNEDENYVYSPLNLYFALAMLAEITDGNSRQQVLTALNVNDLDLLREEISSLWLANYADDGIVSSLLANSFWLSDSFDYKKESLNILAKKYYASSFQGKMGSAEYNQELQNWLNEQTHGLLEKQTQSIELNAQTVLALASAIYYQGKWQDAFMEEATAKDVFHALNGDLTCDFMHLSKEKNYYQGDQFSAVALDIQESGKMWLILPNNTPESLANDAQLMQLFWDEHSFVNMKSALVHLSMPKFDVTAQTDLVNTLTEMGITDIFDSRTADFSALTASASDIFLSQANHSARVSVDENGCTGAAFTMLAADLKSLIQPDDEVNFVLDRPFLFVITSQHNVPLFAGVVHQPIE